MNQTEIIEALVEMADQSIVAVLSGRTWFSDGSVILECEAAPPDESHVRELKGRWYAEKWKDKVGQMVSGVPAGYALAEIGKVRGGFHPQGYVREVRGADGSVVYLQERYVRALPGPGAPAAWTLPSKNDRVYFVRGGIVVGVVMPVRVLDDAPSRPPEWPVIPFLEDVVLYHICPSCEHEEVW